MKIKNVRNVICFVIFFLFANQAWAAGWIYFDKAAVGDVYYGKNSIKKVDKSSILVWNKVILSKEGKTKYFSILKRIHKAPQNPSMLSYYKKLMEIDCVNRKIKDISVTFYNEKGNIIYSSPKSEVGDWNPILPDTVGEKLIHIVSSEPVTPKEAVAAPKVEESVAPEEVDVPKVEKPVTPKDAVAAASPLFAPYSGHVASFKNEDNAVMFVKKMNAKGLVAFYQKEDILGKGELYRAYIGRYKTLPLARKALTKLKTAGEIDFFQIKNTAVKNGEIVKKGIRIEAQKNEPIRKLKTKLNLPLTPGTIIKE